MRIVCFVLCIALAAYSCKSKEKVKRDISAVQITIGQAGGFTGYTTDYIIHGTGKVERYTSKDGKTVEVKTLPADSIKLWVNRMDEISFNNIELNQPGNMSFYIELTEPKHSHKTVWGDAIPPAALQQLYDRMWKSVE